MKNDRLLVWALGMLLLFSCGKEEVGPQGEKEGSLPDQFSNGLFILNEGNFGTNNASVSFYDPAKKQVDNFIYRAANDGRKLGDVLQSITFTEDRAYLIVNNSGKIEIVNKADFRHTGTIEQLKSPRYMHVLNDKAFVTNFVLGNAGNVIYVIDLKSQQVVNTIPVNGWVDHIVQIGNRLYINNVEEDRIMVIDPGTEEVVTSISVNEEPESMVTDKEGYVWVMCTGGLDEGTPAMIRIDPVNNKIVQKMENFPIDDHPSRLRINGTADTLYFLMDGIYKMAITDTELPVAPFIETTALQYVYGLEIDPVNGDIYLTDARDFQQNGEVYRFDRSGRRTDRFLVGEGPGNLVFIR